MSALLQESLKITLQDRVLGEGAPVFVIAEAGINHNGDMKLAEKLVCEAKNSGADAVKFQTYVTEKRVAKDNPVYGVLKQCEMSFEQQRSLAQLAQKVGILFFSTPFDEESMDFLLSIRVPVVKIASFDIVNLEFLRYVASKGVPMIVSRGMASEAEIRAARDLIRDAGVAFALLHCVSSYPNKDENANLRAIATLREKFACVVGYSDHTLGMRVPVLAAAMGASIIEKHFTLDRNMEGPDHSFSCDSTLMKSMVKEIRETEKILGNPELRLLEVEKSAVVFRRPTT